MAKSSTYSDDQVPVGRTDTISFTDVRNKEVISTLPCGTSLI